MFISIPPKTSENLWFSKFFREYVNGTLDKNGLNLFNPSNSVNFFQQTQYKENLCVIFLKHHSAGIYLLKIKYRNTRLRYGICSKLTIQTGVFIDNFENISHLVLVFLLLTLNM